MAAWPGRCPLRLSPLAVPSCIAAPLRPPASWGLARPRMVPRSTFSQQHHKNKHVRPRESLLWRLRRVGDLGMLVPAWTRARCPTFGRIT